jgi:hypothetical protein
MAERVHLYQRKASNPGGNLMSDHSSLFSDLFPEENVPALEASYWRWTRRDPLGERNWNVAPMIPRALLGSLKV